MNLVQQLLQLAADLLVVISKPDDGVAIGAHRMDVYV
jgi:hypothetical protein